MRSLKKNQKKLWYSLYDNSIPVYEADENGNIVFIEVNGKPVPVETGDTRAGYTQPALFYANISAAKGSSSNEVFGINLEYTKSISTTDMTLPINEATRIWDNEPIINDDGSVDGENADYAVVQVAMSLNGICYAVKSLPKG